MSAKPSARILGACRRFVAALALLASAGCASLAPDMKRVLESYTLDYNTPINATLQTELVSIDASLRAQYGMTTEQTTVGILDCAG